MVYCSLKCFINDARERAGKDTGMNRKHFLAGLLCLALLLGLQAHALAAEGAASIPINAIDAAAVTAAPAVQTAAPASSPSGALLDSAALNALVEDFLTQKGIPKDRVGVGYCYTATGDEWFYNPDTWFYPGSMYKVPLMMLVSEQLQSGEISPDTQIGGLDLDTVYEYILVYSNNDYAHKVRSYLGGDEVWREDAKRYAALDSFDERYMLYCYFSPRYMTQVLETLYQAPARFPKVLDNLLKAEQGHYFRLPDSMKAYDIAQKYGAYIDNENSDWNHTAGIVFTPNPFILTIMTKNVGGAEQFIGQLAERFKDYTLELDTKLSAYREEQTRLEAERRAAEEAERLAAAQAAEEPAATAKPAAELRPSQPQVQNQGITADRAYRGHRAGIIVLTLLLIAAIVGGIGAVVIVKERERRRYESYKRRFEAELRQEALERERQRRSAERIAAMQSAAPTRPERVPTVEPAAQPRRPAHPETRRVRRPDTPPRQQRADPVDPDEARWIDEEEE